MSKIIIALDRLHWLWLVLAAPFLLFPTPKRSLAMLVIPVLLLLHWLAGKAKNRLAARPLGSIESHPDIIPSTPLNTAFLLLFVMVLVSLWVTFDITYSLPKITGMVLAFGIFFETVRFAQRPRDWLFCLSAFLLIGLGIALIGLFGTAWSATVRIPILSPLLDRLPRLVSGLQGAESGFHPNEVAGALLWVLPMMGVVSFMMIVAFTKIAKRKKGDPASLEEKGRMAFGRKKRRGWHLAGTLVSLFSSF